MKFFKLLFRQFGIFIGCIIAISVYVWVFIKLCIYSMTHWWTQNDGIWTCKPNNGTITRHTLYCHPQWISSQLHWGLMVFIVVWIFLSVVFGLIIQAARTDFQNEKSYRK